MTKKIIKEESDNEINNEEEEEPLDELSDELNDELNDDLDNEISSQYMTDELINDKDIDTEYIEDSYNINNSISNNEYLFGDDRISSSRLTKYELVRILGERVKQLIMGAKPMIKNYKELCF